MTEPTAHLECQHERWILVQHRDWTGRQMAERWYKRCHDCRNEEPVAREDIHFDKDEEESEQDYLACIQHPAGY